MNRRTLLTAVGTAGTVAVAGCVGDGGAGGGENVDDTNGNGGGSGTDDGGSDDGGTFEDGEDAADAVDAADADAAEVVDDPELVDTAFVATDAEHDEGDARVAFGEDAVYVEGTVVGETGCHAAELETVEMNGGGELEVVVAAVDDSAPDEMCTQALTPRGYVVEATFEEGVPGEVTVVHDDTGGRETVTTESLD